MARITPNQKFSLTVLGLLLALILVEITLHIFSFTMSSLQDYRNLQSIKQKGRYTILCLGESDTAIGGKNSYPRHLEKILNTKNPEIQFSVVNKGLFGTNTTSILASLDDNLKKYKPDMVIAMMGYHTGLTPSERTSSKYSLLKRTDFFLKHFKIFRLTKLIAKNILTKFKRSPTDNQHPKTNHLENESDGIISDVELASKYIQANKFTEAMRILQEEILTNPSNGEAYAELALLYAYQGLESQSDYMIAKAVNLNLEHHEGYIQLGEYYYRYKNNSEKAIKLFKKALVFNPYNLNARISLSACFISQGRYSEARSILNKISDDQNNDRLYGVLAILALEDDAHTKSKDYFSKLTQLKKRYFNPENRSNFQKIKNTITSKQIQFVSVQYPLWNINSLKMMYDDAKDIIFISNEEIFKNAIKRDGYSTYFSDMYAGSFGHPTNKGRQLLAQNIANNLLIKVFKHHSAVD